MPTQISDDSNNFLESQISPVIPISNSVSPIFLSLGILPREVVFKILDELPHSSLLTLSFVSKNDRNEVRLFQDKKRALHDLSNIAAFLNNSTQKKLPKALISSSRIDELTVKAHAQNQLDAYETVLFALVTNNVNEINIAHLIKSIKEIEKEPNIAKELSAVLILACKTLTALQVANAQKNGTPRGLMHMDFSYANLAGIDLSNVNCYESNFREADLTGATLINTKLSHANFEKANLSKVKANRATLLKAKLDQAMLAESNFNGVDCREASFVEANLREATLSEANCNNADFSNAYLGFATLVNSTFEEAKLIDAKFNDTQANFASFRKADLTESIFTYATLINADFTNAQCDLASFLKADLTGTKFFDTNLRFANFVGANFKETDFYNANLYGAHFTPSLISYYRWFIKANSYIEVSSEFPPIHEMFENLFIKLKDSPSKVMIASQILQIFVKDIQSYIGSQHADSQQEAADAKGTLELFQDLVAGNPTENRPSIFQCRFFADPSLYANNHLADLRFLAGITPS